MSSLTSLQLPLSGGWLTSTDLNGPQPHHVGLILLGGIDLDACPSIPAGMRTLHRDDMSLQTPHAFTLLLKLDRKITRATGNFQSGYVYVDQDGPIIRRGGDGIEITALRRLYRIKACTNAGSDVRSSASPHI